MLLQPCFVAVMSRKWGCDKAKSTSCVSKVNYYSRDSHFLFVLVLISPHSWCVLPSGPPLIKPFSCSKLDYPSNRFFPSPPPTLTPTTAPVPSSSKPSHLTCPAAKSFMLIPAAVGWGNNLPKLEGFIGSGGSSLTQEKTTGWGGGRNYFTSLGLTVKHGYGINHWAVNVFILVSLWI